MKTCPHLNDCAFILNYVVDKNHHWEGFITNYCKGNLQDFCKRKEWFEQQGPCPPMHLMPTGEVVPKVFLEEIQRQTAGD